MYYNFLIAFVSVLVQIFTGVSFRNTQLKFYHNCWKIIDPVQKNVHKCIQSGKTTDIKLIFLFSFSHVIIGTSFLIIFIEYFWNLYNVYNCYCSFLNHLICSWNENHITYNKILFYLDIYFQSLIYSVLIMGMRFCYLFNKIGIKNKYSTPENTNVSINKFVIESYESYSVYFWINCLEISNRSYCVSCLTADERSFFLNFPLVEWNYVVNEHLFSRKN